MNFDYHCANRLKSERKRLGFNQAEIATLCGISREIWGKYERGATVPGGNVLHAFAMNGANVQLVLTGENTGGVTLARDELDIVDHYRQAPLAVKAAVLAALTAGSSPSASTTVNVSGQGNRAAGRDYNENNSKK